MTKASLHDRIARRYRLAVDGYGYKVQRRCLWFWIDVQQTVGPIHGAYGPVFIVRHYKTGTEALDNMNSLIASEVSERTPTRPVKL